MPGRCPWWTGQRCELRPGAGAGGRAARRVGLGIRIQASPSPAGLCPRPCPVAGPTLPTRAASRPREEEEEEEAGDSLGAPAPATYDSRKPRDLESPGGPSWRWGRGSGIVPAVGRVPGPARDGRCHPGRLHKPHAGLASVWSPRWAQVWGGRGRWSQGSGLLTPASDPGSARLGPGFLTGRLSGSREPGGGRSDRGSGGVRPPRGAPLTACPCTPGAGAGRGCSQGQRGQRLVGAHARCQSLLPRRGLSMPGHSRGPGQWAVSPAGVDTWEQVMHYS